MTLSAVRFKWYFDSFIIKNKQKQTKEPTTTHILLYSTSKTKHLDIIYAILLPTVTPYGVCLILKINIPQITLFESKWCFKRKEECSQKICLLIKSVKKYSKTLYYCNFPKNLKRGKKMLTSARCSNTSGWSGSRLITLLSSNRASSAFFISCKGEK